MSAISSIRRLFRAATIFCAASIFAGAPQAPGATHFHKQIQPLLTQYCGDCHFDGAKKGNVAFDEFKSDDEILANRELWFKALKNVRAGLMPPAKKAKPSPEEIQKLAGWVKSDVFQIDPGNPDPGKVTIRRMNRIEYRNTIHDLMGYDYKVEEELPPDDTGYGFDTIGDVLTMSPLLMEKYMQAAETITTAAVPRTSNHFKEKTVVEGKKGNNGRLSFYDATTIKNTFKVEKTGTYKVLLELETLGQFDFDPGECHVTLKAGDQEIFAHDFKWESHKLADFEIEQKWDAGEKPLVLEIKPLVEKEKKKNSLDLRLANLRVQGPMEKEYWVRPKNF
jgi:hypothetical protein